MNERIDLLLLTGEASGDLLGAELLQTLKKMAPTLKVVTVGGKEIAKMGAEELFSIDKLQVMGFTDVLFALPRLLSLSKEIVHYVEKKRPRAILTVDYPGFHLRLHKILRRRGYKGLIMHAVCPSVWAWKKGRIHAMTRDLDILLTLLPFEKPLFPSNRLDVRTIGHPLVDRIPAPSKKRGEKSPKGKGENKQLTLFPGSRKKEIERNLPLQLRLAEDLLLARPETSLAISLADTALLPTIQKTLSHHSRKTSLSQETVQAVQIIPSSYTLMENSHLAIATSGTVNLELALHHCPTLVTYKMGKLDFFIAKYLLKINLPFYSLPNLIKNREIFPEYVGTHIDKKKQIQGAGEELLALYDTSKKRAECIKECASIRDVLEAKSGGTMAKEQALRDFLRRLGTR